MSAHKFQTKSTPDLDSPAILRLEETLKQNNVNINLHGPTRFEVLVERLHKSMPGLAEKSLGEILLAGDAGATAKVLSIVWDAAKDPFLTIGRRLCQVYQTENSSVKIPAAKKSSHDWGAGRASEETYTFVTIDVAKSGGLARVSKEMIEDAEWDVVQRQLRELGEAYSEFQSKFILTDDNRRCDIPSGCNSKQASLQGRYPSCLQDVEGPEPQTKCPSSESTRVRRSVRRYRDSELDNLQRN